MIIKIGTIIKKLRAENGVTQEALATAVGVTPQAISRWESEGGYPDIELLPALADFFSVSTDELLGYKLSQREQSLADIKSEMVRLDECGTLEECLSFARDAFSRYPTDPEIKVFLAAYLSDHWKNTRDDRDRDTAENLCLSVIDSCHDEEIRYNAIVTLAGIYTSDGDTGKTKNVLNLLSPLKYCREVAIAQGIGDGNTELYIQNTIDILVSHLCFEITNLAINGDVPNDPSTWDKKIEMLTVSNQLYRLIYGENLMFNHHRLSENYYLIATYQLAQGKQDDALSSLERMCEHAVAYDKAYRNDHGKHYTSIFTDKLIYPEPGKDFHELFTPACYYKLGRLHSKRFDAIRQDTRFTAIVDTLKAHAE